MSVKATCWQPGLNCRHGGSLIGNPVGIITSLDLDLKPSSHKLPWLFKPSASQKHYFFHRHLRLEKPGNQGKPRKSFYVCTVGEMSDFWATWNGQFCHQNPLMMFLFCPKKPRIFDKKNYQKLHIRVTHFLQIWVDWILHTSKIQSRFRFVRNQHFKQKLDFYQSVIPLCNDCNHGAFRLAISSSLWFFHCWQTRIEFFFFDDGKLGSSEEQLINIAFMAAGGLRLVSVVPKVHT